MVLPVLKPSGEGKVYYVHRCFVWSFIQEEAHYHEPFLVRDDSGVIGVSPVEVKMFRATYV